MDRAAEMEKRAVIGNSRPAEPLHLRVFFLAQSWAILATAA